MLLLQPSTVREAFFFADKKSRNTIQIRTKKTKKIKSQKCFTYHTKCDIM